MSRTGVQSWSKTASNNSNADSAAPWPEGMAPSQVNDSARGGMASVAKYRDDTNGTLVTSGTSTAYTVTSNQVFGSLADMDGAKLTIKFDETSGAAPTLSVDSLTAKPLQSVAGTAVPDGFFVADSIWTIVYDNSNSAFIVHGVPSVFGDAQFTGTVSAQDVDIAGILDCTGTDHVSLPSGTTAQRNASPSAGDFRYNSDLKATEIYDGTSFVSQAPILPVPQGYLTPVSGTPIITGDSSGASTIYYTPLNGNFVVLHNGSQLIPYQLSGELTLALTSSQAASGIYDVFLAYNSGTPVIGTGPSWSSGTSGSVTAGSCARGTGTGGAALTRLNGVYVNAASMSLIWNTGSGNTTLTVSANQGVYVGSIYIDGTAGQVTCHRSYGQSRKWGIWNAYNRAHVYLKVGDSTVSWNYNTNAFRASNGNTANSFTAFVGLPEETISCDFRQNVTLNNGNHVQTLAIGVNGSTSPSDYAGIGVSAVASNVPGNFPCSAQLIYPPSLGINTFGSLENGIQATTTFYGVAINMLFSGQWRA